MTDADRIKWDGRYAEPSSGRGAGSASSWLLEHLHRVQPGPALDVACGMGRNAIHLARHGFHVDAIDISKVGLHKAAQLAPDTESAVNWLCADLLSASTGLELKIPRRDYQLIVMCFFVDEGLLDALPYYLAPGGWLLVEEHMVWPTPVAGPHSDRFRVQPGALAASFEGLMAESPEGWKLELVAQFEGTVATPEGSLQALSRLLVRRVG